MKHLLNILRGQDLDDSKGRDKSVLEKFKKGATINSEEELRILERYASTGMVRFGFSYKSKKGEAALTRQGKWFLKQL